MIKVAPTVLSLALLCGLGTFENAQAQNEDLWQDITEDQYLRALDTRESNLRVAEGAAAAARTALNQTLMLLAEAQEEFDGATALFAEIEANPVQPNASDSLNEAWLSVRSAWDRLRELAGTRDRLQDELSAAEWDLQLSRIGVENLKNNFQAQSDALAVGEAIARCATQTCLASDWLNDERFSVFQPQVLEMIGAHHAYAKGLTGKGVRIGVEDNVVGYRLPEFEGRISFEGATLFYPLYPGDHRHTSAQTCDQATADEQEELKCKVFSYESLDDTKLFDNLVVRWVVAGNGWPGDGETWYIRNDSYEDGEWGRWAIVPHGGNGRDARGRVLTHGTNVASVAAGRDYGVAPGATIVPIATDFSWQGQSAERQATQSLLRLIRDLPTPERLKLDADVAIGVTANYQHYDIINRSFGIGVFDPASISTLLDDETQWWGEGLRKILPQTWRALMQTGVDPDERTIVVYAAGNATQEQSGLGADIPRYETHVRGSQLAVMAVAHDGYHADYTNFCGPLPSDWEAGRWGRHFCIAAPGTVNAASSLGWNYVALSQSGTSFAAPVVSGALALLMEYFRGQLGNTEIVKRLVNTADNTGHYAQLEIYGAGLLDLQAALQPVGRTSTGTPTAHKDTAMTLLGLPTSIGGLGQRFAAQGVEVASLDSMGAPFWSSPARYMQVMPWRTPRLGPVVSGTNDVVGEAHLSFAQGTIGIPLGAGARDTSSAYRAWGSSNETSGSAYRLLMGEGRIGLERSSGTGFQWGVLEDRSSWLGGYSSGAFGNNIRSTMVWLGRSARFELDAAWAISLSGTLALTRADLPSYSMLQVDPHVMSTWQISAERGVRGNGRWFRFALSQPLRAETGAGTLTYLAGLKDGQPSYDRATASLAPEGREVEMSLVHETPIGRGRLAVEIAHSFNFLHTPGRGDSRFGLAYRYGWE